MFTTLGVPQAERIPPKYGVVKGSQSTLFDIIERIGDGPEYTVILQGYHTEAGAIEVVDWLQSNGERPMPTIEGATE